MSMSSPTTNWHRKTKHVSGWAKEWFTSELAGASKQDGSDTITVERLTNFDGDVEIGRRKNKVIMIYDRPITPTQSAEEADNAAVKGTIVIPEVSHENMLDGVSDYAYEYSTTSPPGDAKQIGALPCTRQIPSSATSRECFRALLQSLLEEDGKDIAVVVTSEGNTPSQSGMVTLAKAPPTTAKPTANNTISGSTTVNTAISACLINTTTIKVSRRFRPVPKICGRLFADENRILM